MNYKMMGRFLSQILFMEALFMIPALAISLGYRETLGAEAFGITIALILAVALVLSLVLAFSVVAIGEWNTADAASSVTALEKKQDKLNAQIKALEKQLANAKKSQASAMNQKNILSPQISALQVTQETVLLPTVTKQ